MLAARVQVSALCLYLIHVCFIYATADEADAYISPEGATHGGCVI